MDKVDVDDGKVEDDDEGDVENKVFHWRGKKV